MATFLLIFLAALLLAYSLTPVMRHLAARTGTVDQPSSRKLHYHPIPLLGGVALYLASIAALLLFSDRFYVPQLLSILLGATLVSFLGIWDDRHGLRPLFKLGGQLAAALILILSGIQVSFLPWEWANLALTLLWVVGITNAMNLLDNMDGLSGGIAAVAAAFFFLLAAFSGQYLVASLAAALLGACLGFLRYNFNPASIFMGDAGSLFLGFMLAAVGLKLRFENTAYITWMVPVLVLGLPIFDTVLVTVSRLRRGLNPFVTPGKDHLSHRLVAGGMSQREAVLTLYIICGALGVVAMVVSRADFVEAYAAGSAALLFALIALIRLEMAFGKQLHPPARAQAQSDEAHLGSEAGPKPLP